jgi:Flp pilus assembly protein TadG
MRILFVIFVLALLAIVFEVYSDVSLTSANVSHAARDVAAAAIAHGVKRE